MLFGAFVVARSRYMKVTQFSGLIFSLINMILIASCRAVLRPIATKDISDPSLRDVGLVATCVKRTTATSPGRNKHVSQSRLNNIK